MGIAILTVTNYSLAILFQGLRLSQLCQWCGKGFLFFGLTAVSLHAFLLYQWIDQVNFFIGNGLSGQNMYALNVLSFVCWLSSLLLLIALLKKPVSNLAMISFMGAVISIILVLLFPGMYMVDTRHDPRHLIHIFFSLFAFSILSIAVIQSFLLVLQDFLLRQKQTAHWLSFFPPLQTMEAMLFELIGLGFIFLSVVLASSLIFYDGTVMATMTHSPYLAFLAWFIFAILLFGRFYFGWRGRVAIRWTLYGVCLLLLSYLSGWLWLKLGTVRHLVG